jgi:MSHA biogenesis protein MshI
LSFTDYQILSLEAPAVPAVELKQAVRWRLKDMLDYHIDDATIDVLSVPADRGMAARSNTMFAVAARSQLVGQLHDLFDKAGVEVRVIDIPDMAQRNISALVEPNGHAVAMLSVNADSALVTLTSGGELYFSRRIDVTAAQLKQLDSDAILACYDRISLELQRSLDHFDRQFHYLQMSKLVLAPMGNSAEALQSYLSDNLHIPVETLDLESVLDLSKIPELKNKEMQQRHFLVIGAALRHEEAAL